jgi:transcriptional regulator with XRE-family HTH domain
VDWNGAAIRAIRKCQHLTQTAIARECHFSQGHLANVEAGRDRLNDANAMLVAKALGLDDLRAIAGKMPDEPMPVDA